MIERECNPGGSDCHWVVRPNQSLSWRSALRFYTIISICCLGIGVAFALHGFWPVLPFAGLEVAVLGIAFYLCLSRGQMREVISVNAELVSVDKGRYQPKEHWECPRAWARISLQRSKIAWYPQQLAVAFQGERVVIGKFLNDEERSALASELHQVIHSDDWLKGSA